MRDPSGWATAFEQQRPRLRAVAYRVLGSSAEAEDAVQEAWLRLQRSGPEQVDDLAAWLTTVTARICLNLLRSRGRRREDPLDARLPEPLLSPAGGLDPEQEALLADAVGLALVVVLETLSPPERVAFVLHDLFAVPFEEIGSLLERSPAAARQLASRARRRVRDRAPAPDHDVRAQRAVVDAFYAAARRGDVAGLVAVLHPDVVLRADAGPGRRVLVRGARDVAGQAALAAAVAPLVRPVLVHGTAGGAVVVDGRVRTVMAFTVSGGRITTLEVLQDPGVLACLEPPEVDGAGTVGAGS